MLTRRRTRSLLVLALGWCVLMGVLLVFSQSHATVAASVPVQPQGMALQQAEIAWTRVYSGMLNGWFYNDLYWGGNAGQHLALVDIDNDGDLDLFMAGESRQESSREQLHFYRNDGAPAAPVWTHVTDQYFAEPSTSGENRPVFADLDADGDYDYVGKSGDGAPGEGFAYYENIGNASTPAWVLRTRDMLGNTPFENGAGTHTLADIDGDNDLDFFYTYPKAAWTEDEYFTTAFYENTGDATAPVWTFVTDTYNGITATDRIHPTFADIDADNDLDLFLGTSTQIMFYRNDGNATSPVWTHVTDTYGGIQYGWGATHFQVAFGDLNGDATLDMMIAHGIGWVTSYRNTGTVVNAAWTLWEDPMFPMNYGGYANPALADIDADGDDDLFLGTAGAWDDAYFIFLRNDGSALLPEWTYVTGEYGAMEVNGVAFPTFVDINGDGDLDCFIGSGPFFGSPGGTLSYFENTGTAIAPVWAPISDTYLFIDEPDRDVVPAFADIDGEGDQDLFVSIEGQHRFYRNDGNAAAPVWTLVTQSYAGVSGNALAFSDVDSDGDLDLFTDLAFYRNDGNAVAAAWSPAQAPQGVDWSEGALALGDILGNDGRPELVLGGNGGIYVYRNLGDLPPQVIRVAPADGGSGLQVGAIVAAFDNTMDAATVTEGNIAVVGSASGAVAGAVVYEPASKQLVFLPEGSLAEGETVNVTLKAALSDATGHALDGDGDGMAEGSPTDDVAWQFTVHERDHLVIGLPEPESLYLYAANGIVGTQMLDAIYEGPIGNRSYGYQPIILTKLPSIADGDAVLRQVIVEAGDRVVDTYNDVITLTAGAEVRPAGCRSTDCAVVFDGAALRMDQLAVTFELLPGIRWSDGAALTADDSLYGYEIHRTQPWVSPDFPPTPDQLAHTASYEALDTLHTRWTGLPGYLDSRYQLIFWHPLPRHAWEGQGLTPEDLQTAPESNRAPLGWGPYAVETWEPGVAITLTANPYYYRAAEGLPKIDTLVFHFVQDADLALAQVLAGETDFSWTIYGLPDALLAFEGYGAVNAHVEPGVAWEHADFAIDTNSGYSARPDFFEDREMRQAIAYCLDRAAFADAATAGYAPVMHTYIPAEHPLYPGDAALTLYPHSVASGTQLLEGLGWTDANGDGVRECNGCTTAGASPGDPLVFNWTTMDIPLRTMYAAMARADLAECGIDLVVDVHLQADLWSRIFQRRYDMASFAWISDFEPSCSLYLSDQIPTEANGWSGNNNTAFSNAAYDAACTGAMTSLPGTAEYVANHHEAMRILSEEAPIIPLFARLNTAAAHPRLTGPHLDATSMAVLDNIATWAFLADGLPPDGMLEAGDGAQAQAITPVTLHLDATDRGGGVVARMLIRERVWDGDDWGVAASTSGWIPYAATYGWDLDPTPGVHYLSAYFMDDSDNASALPAQTLVNLTPASADILADGIAVYRARMHACATLAVTLTTHSGDADLYVWAPGSTGTPDAYSNLDGAAQDQVVITGTVAGDYHIEVRGYAPASAYHLDLDAPALSPAAVRAVTGAVAQPMSKPIPEAPLTRKIPDDQPADAPGGLPAAADARSSRMTLDAGADSVLVTGELWDQKGTPVADGTPVTVTTTLGSLDAQGAKVKTTTTQGGLVRATLIAGKEEGVAELFFQAGPVKAQLDINIRWPYRAYVPVVLRGAP